MARFFSLAALVVGGLIVADIVIHGTQVQAASQGIRGIETPVIQGLLGSTPTG